MPKNNFKILSYLLITVFLTLGLSISFQSLLAVYTAPLANPSACSYGDPGCDEPINKGPLSQTKGGPLRVNMDNLAATGFAAYGNVGIGTVNPGAKLDVVGNYIQTQEGTVADYYHTVIDGYMLFNFHSKVNQGSDRGFILFQDDSEQTVPAGTTEDVRFTFGAYNDGGSGHADEIWLQGPHRIVQNTGTWDAEMNSIVGTVGQATDASTPYLWKINNADKMVLSLAGNLGVGTTNPTAMLQLNPSTNTEGLKIVSSNYSPFIIRNSTDTADLFRIDQNGSLNITGDIINLSGTANFVPSNRWTIGSGSVGIFNQNGATSENSREWGIGPHSNRTILWKGGNDADSNDDGGWNTNGFNINHAKSYRFTVWIKRTGGANGSFYFGCSGSNVTYLNGTAEGNPYFYCGGLPELDKWYLAVGYIHGSGDLITSSFGGLYDGVTGRKVISFNGGSQCTTDYKFTTSATQQYHRTYLYYSTDVNVRQFWWDPRVEEVNGSEPTIEALLGLDKGATQDSLKYFGGSVGIGTAGPRSGYLLNVNGKLATENNVKIFGTDEAWAENLVLIKASGWGGVRFARNDPAAGNYSGDWAIGYNASTGNDFSVSTNYNGTQYDGLLHISNTTRNVGIGMTSPAERLDVNGNIRAGSAGAGYLYVGNRGYYIGDDLDGSDIQTNAPNMYVNDGGWKRLLREGDSITATNADTTDGVHLNSNSWPTVGGVHFYGVGGDSGQGADVYGIFQEGGAWSYPFPDLRIAYHTGIKLGANASYNGIRFYNDYDMSGLVMSINDSATGGANNVYIPNIAYVGDLRASIMYDWNDTGYYLDPNGTSNINRITNRTKASFGNNGLYNTPRWDYTGDTRYWTGAMGWGTTDFNTIYSNWGSGFFDTWSSPGNAPGGSSHYVGLQGFHFNHGDGTNAYGFQMAMAGEADNRFFWRSGWPSPRPWVEMIHTGNIGSQIVGNADTVDYYHVSVAGNANTLPTRNASGYLIPENWIQLNGYYGLYSPNNGAYLYPNNGSYGSWRIAGSRNSWYGLEFDTAAGQTSLMVGTTGQNWGGQMIGFHNNSYGWLWYAIHNNFYANSFNYISDERLKKDFSAIDNALLKLSDIDGVYFKWKDETNGKGLQVGVTAQNVEKVLPELVTTNIDGYKTVDYSRLSAVIIEAIKEQQKQIENLKKEIENLKNSNK